MERLNVLNVDRITVSDILYTYSLVEVEDITQKNNLFL